MAGARDVTTFGMRHVNDEAGFRRTVLTPVLLWEAPPQQHEEPLLFATRSGQQVERPAPGRAVFFFVEKSAKNAFADEVTLGRTVNNDITIDDNSVSRFHAYFAPGKQGAGWTLVDAKSTAGTFLGDQRLEPRAPVPVANETRVRIGRVELLFLEPDGFWRYLRGLIQPKK